MGSFRLRCAAAALAIVPCLAPIVVVVALTAAGPVLAHTAMDEEIWALDRGSAVKGVAAIGLGAKGVAILSSQLRLGLCLAFLAENLST